MKKLTSTQRDELTEQFAELVVDSMDLDTLISYAQEQLIDALNSYSLEELKQDVDNYDEELYEELVDNVTTETTEVK
tara:strand:+ start:1788 stop:2018 length:231 start_codon:yes stop_codon:yes gene_type:complete